MLSDDAAIISTCGTITTAVRRPTGGVSINQGRSHINLNAVELQQLIDFMQIGPLTDA